MKDKSPLLSIYILNIVVLLSIFFLNFYTLNFFISNGIGDLSKGYFEIHARDIVNDDIVKIVSDFCNLKSDKFYKIHCLNDFVVRNYNYNFSEIIAPPNQMIENGTDCKGYSVFYAAVLTNMKIDYEFVSPTGHVYIVAYTGDFYCSLDQGTINCFKYSDGDIKYLI